MTYSLTVVKLRIQTWNWHSINTSWRDTRAGFVVSKPGYWTSHRQTNLWTANSRISYGPILKDNFPHMAKTYGMISTNYPRHRCLSCTCISVAIGQFIVELTVHEMSNHYRHYVSRYEHEMYHLCQYDYDTSSANCKHNNINQCFFVKEHFPVPSSGGNQCKNWHAHI